MSTLVFLLDTSVFIQAARSFYSFDIVPSFWESLLRHAEKGEVVSIDRVKDEIDRGDDEITSIDVFELMRRLNIRI